MQSVRRRLTTGFLMIGTAVLISACSERGAGVVGTGPLDAPLAAQTAAPVPGAAAAPVSVGAPALGMGVGRPALAPTPGIIGTPTGVGYSPGVGLNTGIGLHPGTGVVR